MSITMARIKNNQVINIEEWPDTQEETQNLIRVNDLNINIGDTYINNKFYDNNNIERISEIQQLINYIEILSDNIYQEKYEIPFDILKILIHNLYFSYENIINIIENLYNLEKLSQEEYNKLLDIIELFYNHIEPEGEENS